MLIKIHAAVYANLKEGDEVGTFLPPEEVGQFMFDPAEVTTKEDQSVLTDTFLKLITQLTERHTKDAVQ